MSRKKPDGVYSGIYAGYLNPKNNPVQNQQSLTEMMYRRHLTELCVNRFKWEGMPEEIDLRFLEMNLFYTANVIFFKNRTNNKFMVARATGQGFVNHYDNPTEWGVILPNAVQTEDGPVYEKYTTDECVPIWGNATRTPDIDVVNLYSMQMANISRTIEINTGNLRYTKVLTVSEEQRQSWSNIMKKVKEGEEIVLGTQALDLGMVQALDVGAHPETMPKLLEAKSKLWNEGMGLLGINNANQDKKERLVADEVSANDEQVLASRNYHLKARKFACEQINRMWPELNVSVKFDDMEDAASPGAADEPEESEASDDKGKLKAA